MHKTKEVRQQKSTKSIKHQKSSKSNEVKPTKKFKNAKELINLKEVKNTKEVKTHILVFLLSTLKEEVDDEDWSKRNEEVRRDDGDDEEGATDHRDAAQEGSELLRDLWVDHVDVRREPDQD